jgi:DNA-binding phage protein
MSLTLVMKTGAEILIRRVRQQIDRSKMPLREIARRAGIHHNTLRSFRDFNWNPQVQTLHKLEEALASPPIARTASRPTGRNADVPG